MTRATKTSRGPPTPSALMECRENLPPPSPSYRRTRSSTPYFACGQPQLICVQVQAESRILRWLLRAVGLTTCPVVTSSGSPTWRQHSPRRVKVGDPRVSRRPPDERLPCSARVTPDSNGLLLLSLCSERRRRLFRTSRWDVTDVRGDPFSVPPSPPASSSDEVQIRRCRAIVE